ncbi:hypothetical protein [Streptomyces sp. SID3343]|uniref:hypothetical protein n=1 Tax=Streptomyces sp. SID3343 TaxID=2690260 RepID=UPI00136E4754|nr:hypothetical protein [Streptomyces sp. SID3343]MYV98688.1 hypothetical protein [Streptomyces sp. SID3343]
MNDDEPGNAWDMCAEGHVEHEWVYQYGPDGPAGKPWAKACKHCGKMAGANVPESRLAAPVSGGDCMGG